MLLKLRILLKLIYEQTQEESKSKKYRIAKLHKISGKKSRELCTNLYE